MIKFNDVTLGVTNIKTKLILVADNLTARPCLEVSFSIQDKSVLPKTLSIIEIPSIGYRSVAEVNEVYPGSGQYDVVVHCYPGQEIITLDDPEASEVNVDSLLPPLSPVGEAVALFRKTTGV